MGFIYRPVYKTDHAYCTKTSTLKNRLCENKELENQLKVSKEDIKQLKLYHMYTVT